MSPMNCVMWVALCALFISIPKLGDACDHYIVVAPTTGPTTAGPTTTTAGVPCDPEDTRFADFAASSPFAYYGQTGDLVTGFATLSCNFSINEVIFDGVETYQDSGMMVPCNSGTWGEGTEAWECVKTCGKFPMDCSTDPVAVAFFPGSPDFAGAPEEAYTGACSAPSGFAPANCLKLSVHVEPVLYDELTTAPTDWVLPGALLSDHLSCDQASDYKQLIFLDAATGLAHDGTTAGVTSGNVCMLPTDLTLPAAYEFPGFYACAYAIFHDDAPTLPT